MEFENVCDESTVWERLPNQILLVLVVPPCRVHVRLILLSRKMFSSKFYLFKLKIYLPNCICQTQPSWSLLSLAARYTTHVRLALTCPSFLQISLSYSRLNMLLQFVNLQRHATTFLWRFIDFFARYEVNLCMNAVIGSMAALPRKHYLMSAFYPGITWDSDLQCQTVSEFK